MTTSMLAQHLRPGDHVVIGQAAAEPAGLVAELIELAPRLGSLDVFCGYSFNPMWAQVLNPALRVSTYCGLGTVRHQVARGSARVIPAQLSQLSAHFSSGKLRADVVLLQVAPVDAEGYHSLGCAVDHVWDAAQAARAVLVEVNQQMPPTRSICRLHQSRVVVARQIDAPLAEPPHEAPSEVQARVAQQVARLVPNGAAIQLGIGGLAAAVAAALVQHRGLKLRSGMAGDWLLDLLASGAIDTAHPEACLVSLVAGSRSLYQSLGAGKPLELAPVARLVAAPASGAAFPLIAINSAIEADLVGQVNAELLGERYVGAMGGQADYLRAARRSPGGLAIIALPSTTVAKAGPASDGAVGANGTAVKSRIVRRLANAYVTSAQSDIDFIVTEHGAADLRATTLEERRRLIAQIADPRFRADLLNGDVDDAA